MISAEKLKENEFIKALEAFGRIRLSVNSLELFTTLIFTGKMTPRAVSSTFPVPPYGTLTLDIPVPKDKVAINAEWRMLVDRDHALQLYVYIDGKPIMMDYDVVQALYNDPISFFRIGAVIPVKEKVTIVLKNKTTDWVNVTVMEIYGEIDYKLFDALLNRYFNTVVTEASR
jgi:hypothetical protein